MKNKGPIVFATICAAVLASFTAIGQVTKGKTRPLTTKQLMSGLVFPNCKGIGDALKGTVEGDEAWAALATKAALLNEGGHILMADGRCPDAVWAGAAKTLRENSAALLEQIDKQDLAGAKEAFKAMTGACGACHKAHKKS